MEETRLHRVGDMSMGHSGGAIDHIGGAGGEFDGLANVVVANVAVWRGVKALKFKWAADVSVAVCLPM